MDSNNFNEFIEKRQKSLNIKPKKKLNKDQDLGKSLDSTRRKEQDLKHQKDKHVLAVDVYKRLFIAICVYIILVLLLLIGNKHYFQLDYLVLIALLSTTTANILGVFHIASKWLFPNKE